MSSTQMLTNNALTVKLFSKKSWANIGMNSAFGWAAKNGIIFFANDLVGTRARGDNITYSYINKLTGIPQGEGGTMDGNEEAMNLGSYQIAMGITRVGTLNPNEDTIEQQRTNVDFATMANSILTNRHAELFDTSFFYQAAGSNPTSFFLNATTWSGLNKAFVQGNNPIVPPTANRIVRANNQATDQALTSSDRFSLDLLDFALEKNRNSDHPLEYLSDGTLALFISPEQGVDLRQDAGSKIQWNQNQQSILTSGKDGQLISQRLGNSKMIYLGQYADVKIFEAGRVAYGLNSGTNSVISSTRRAVLMGKDAITFASPYASKLSEDLTSPLKFVTETKDYGYYKGMEARAIYGMKKTTPTNGEDVGTIVLSTYAAPHA